MGIGVSGKENNRRERIPGLKRAGSILSGLFVAAMTVTLTL